ncbi:MAG: sigma-70 family RNA polymerase sigma factor [Planctomycetales bacterium]|nr:sigma-70 family RNA polymerase sigma factor [Planctomycetales bacterium]
MSEDSNREYPDFESTSTTLIEQLKLGDNDSWSFFVFVYRPLIYSWATRFGATASEAEDIQNEVVASVLDSLKSFEKGERKGSFRKWLKTITHRRTVDFLRKRGAAADGGTQAMDRINQIPEPHEDTTTRLPDDDRKIELDRALAYWKNRVKPHTYQAFHRVVVEGHEPQDVAEDLEIDIQVVYQACSRMLTRLRNHLGDDFDQPE